MRRFERSSHCLAPVATVHAAAAWFCWLPQMHGKSLEHLSMHGLELRTSHVGFNVEDTGMGAAAGGVACSKFSSGRVEGGPNSPRAARRRRSHSLLEDVKPAQEGQETP